MKGGWISRRAENQKQRRNQMDQIDYIKRFVKFLAVSQAIGTFYAITLRVWRGELFCLFVVPLIPLLTASILLYYFFKGLKMTPQHYLLGSLLYILMGLLFFVPFYFGVDFFVLFIFWDFVYGVSLVLIIVGKRFLPQLMRYSKKQLGSVSWESKVQDLKNISFRKAGIIVLAVLVIFVSIRFWSGSRKEDKCRKLMELAAEYGELVEDNRKFAEKYERDGEELLNRDGNVRRSIQGAMIAGGLSLQYSAKANKFAEKLKEVQKEMEELGCK